MENNIQPIYAHSTLIRVRYGETDQMGYCYYGNYAQYFEVGRVEALRALGMSYKKLEDLGYMLPVADFSVQYKAPAFYDDELKVVTKIVQLKGVRLYFDYSIFNSKNQLISTAKTTLVFVSKENRRPVTPPVEFSKIFNEQAQE
ncbi:thioesterase [Brumimicrobium salinarum]|uniref:Thioesterase n=1 Tax=Brumimicrobium salinarum TaxID=2058658 RepID=A0A2I0R4M1_9FLAO|nr:thioesterase family protein [Brumimicrobium salinarum]PKR81531.1 thioesterase [Brumimicrobium salinarum]